MISIFVVTALCSFLCASACVQLLLKEFTGKKPLINHGTVTIQIAANRSWELQPRPFPLAPLVLPLLWNSSIVPNKASKESGLDLVLDKRNAQSFLPGSPCLFRERSRQTNGIANVLVWKIPSSRERSRNTQTAKNDIVQKHLVPFIEIVRRCAAAVLACI
jgi:hypothetical protein